jgi:hypothetical protein
MSRTVTISDDLAALVEARRQEAGLDTMDAAAEALIASGLVASSAEDDHSLGHSDDELRAMIAEAETSGTAEPWDPRAARAEVLRRFAALRNA